METEVVLGIIGALGTIKKGLDYKSSIFELPY